MVDNSLWRIQKFPISAAVDIFNALGEKLEKWEQTQHKDNQLVEVLEVASLMASRATLDSTVDNAKV